MVITSSKTLGEIKVLEKYNPKALSLYEADNNGKLQEVFKVGSTDGEGSINQYGASFGSATHDENGFATITMSVPKDVEDVVGYAADKVGAAVMKLNKVEEQFALAINVVNAERQAKEIETLDWEDSTYSYCCNRAVQIVTTFNNEQKKSYYGENISKTDATFEDADAAAKFIHEIWSKSENDQNNYLDTSYISCSIAVYFKDGTWYAVETFSAPYSADFARQELLESSIDAYASTYGYCQHSVCSEPAFEYGDHWICSKCYGILSYDYNAKYNDRKFSCGCLAADSGIEQTDSGYKCINCGKTVEVHEVEFDDEMTTEAVYYYD